MPNSRFCSNPSTVMFREIGPRSGPTGAADTNAMAAQPQRDGRSRHRGHHQVRHRRHDVEKTERVDDLAAERQHRRSQHAGHLLEHLRAVVGAARRPSWPSRRAIARSRSTGSSMSACRATNIPGDLISHRRGVAVAAYVDRHEGDEVRRQCLASLIEQTSECATRGRHHEVGHRRPVRLRRSFGVRQWDAHPVIDLFDPGATVQ